MVGLALSWKDRMAGGARGAGREDRMGKTGKINLRGLRLRFVLLVVAIVASIAICNLHIGAVGGRFELALPEFQGEQIRDTYVEPEGMAEVTDIRYEADGTPVLVVEAGEPNSGMIGYTLDNGGGISMLSGMEMVSVLAGD